MQFTVKEKSISKDKIYGSNEIYESFKDLANADQESFWVIGINNGNHEMMRCCCHLGGSDSCTVDPKIIFKRLLCVDATAFIAVHNHPGGNHKPSQEDRIITEKLKKGGEILSIRFLDHIIVGEDGYYSFADEGVL